MCGIFGMVGETDVVNQVVAGLKKLEYRGYDSSGIALLTGNELKTVKQVGEIAHLEKKLKINPEQSTIAIAHTRWATHGKPSVANAHPHVSENGQIALVHNGIIENYLELKQQMPEISFISQTDTEVAVQLLQHQNTDDCLRALKNTCDQLKGSYAFAVISSSDPHTIYATKKDSPLVVALGKVGGIVSSDSAPILDYTNQQYVLNNNEYVKITASKLEFFDKNLQEICKEPILITSAENEISLQNYPHYMLKEIYEIPQSVNRLLSFYPTPYSVFKSVPKGLLKRTKQVMIVACGTAYHAGLLGARIIKDLAGCEVQVEIASEFRYSHPSFHPNTLAVFISQSGETADTLAALKLCKEQKIPTLSLVNVANSTLTFESKYVLYTHAGKEVAVASTKAYIAQGVLLHLLAGAMAVAKERAGENEYLSQIKLFKEVFSLTSFLQELTPRCLSWAKNLTRVNSIYLIGRQQDYCTAQEAALKLKEITYIHSEAYPAGELKHGTISLIVPGTLVIAFITDEQIAEKTLNAVHEVLSRGTQVLLITTLPGMHCEGVEVLQLPPVGSCYAPLVSILPIQLLAYHLSVALGYNPDKPRNLAKSVTVE